MMTLVAGAINLRCCIVMSANLRGVKIAIRMELTMESGESSVEPRVEDSSERDARIEMATFRVAIQVSLFGYMARSSRSPWGVRKLFEKFILFVSSCGHKL